MMMMIKMTVIMMSAYLFLSVDGGWGEWQLWEPCSKSCGMGEKVRSRECDRPSPQYGGKSCFGESMEKMTCNTKPCPGKVLSVVFCYVFR